MSARGYPLSHVLSEENVDGLLEQAERKTKEEVKEIVAALCPKPAAEPTIRRKPAGARSGVSRETRSDSTEPDQIESVSSGGGGESESPKLSGSVEVASPGLYNFRFSARKSLKQKIEGQRVDRAVVT